jgi:hypothetical protein
MTKPNIDQIIEQSKTLTADGFKKYMIQNGVQYCQTEIENAYDINEGVYAVELTEHDIHMMFMDGEFCGAATLEELMA